MAFDPKCYDLARAFLDDITSEDAVNELAQYIQDSIEEWLEDEAQERKQLHDKNTHGVAKS